MRKKDREIIRLLNERSQISVRIGQVKGQTGLEVYNPAQEARVLHYLQELNDGPLSDRQVTSIFREILSASRDLQKPMNIAYLGPEASFSAIRRRDCISVRPAVSGHSRALHVSSMKWKKAPWNGALCPWKIHWKGR
ncbi:MAG: chorismate mutase [Desulfobacterales bacterium]|nr:chorismate mutase [Desulfobacterales bacterium]